MGRWLFFSMNIIILFSFGMIEAEEKKTICLNMIIKDESKVITRCLASVKPIIDYWVIVDTGSTDGTQTIVQEFMKDVPGELHEKPWKNFAHNRNEALQLAHGKADYVLIIDADEVLEYEKDFKLPALDKDCYFIKTHFGGMKYDRSQLISNKIEWKWKGVLHEALYSDEPLQYGRLEGAYNFVRTDGARSQDPHKYDKDAAVLEKGLVDEPNNSRYCFYLAQSYRDGNHPELALKNYKKRMEMGGWDQEIFWSLFQIALLQEKLKESSDTIIEGYKKAYEYRPTRIEPLYWLTKFYRTQENHLAGYETALKGLSIRDSNDLLFVEKWIYDYGLLFEFSICAYWVGKYNESLLASYLVLAASDLPQFIRERTEANLVWIKAKIQESKGALLIGKQ